MFVEAPRKYPAALRQQANPGTRRDGTIEPPLTAGRDTSITTMDSHIVYRESVIDQYTGPATALRGPWPPPGGRWCGYGSTNRPPRLTHSCSRLRFAGGSQRRTDGRYGRDPGVRRQHTVRAGDGLVR